MQSSWRGASQFLSLLLIAGSDAEHAGACGKLEACEISFIQTQFQVNFSQNSSQKAWVNRSAPVLQSSEGRVDQDYFRYWFMLPTGVMVATCCQLAGIGGAALFSPLFMLVFPLLGPAYPLKSDAESIATSLLIQGFGFSSGLLGFALRGLVDWRASLHFAQVAVPVALAGALAAGHVAASKTLLYGLYSVLMFLICGFLLVAPKKKAMAAQASCEVKEQGKGEDAGREERSKVSSDGQTTFTYLAPERDRAWLCATSLGAFITGLLGVGIGETLLPQLLRGCRMPLPVAAGTSVATVVATAMTAAAVQFAVLAREAHGDILSVVPWPLMVWTLPGVVIGGQVAPCIASRGILSDDAIETFAVTLFAVVGASYLATLAF